MSAEIQQFVHITGQKIVNRNQAELVDITDVRLMVEIEQELCGAI